MNIMAHAKINLTLRVLARETTGFHSIETVFARIALADTLRIEEGPPGIHLEVSGADVGPITENLVYRAAAAHAHATGVESALNIRLQKRIPAGAGLGGGSSDAAAALRELERRAGPAGIGPERLYRLACELGSDVPFFLGAPFAIAWGRGDRCLEIPAPPDRPVVVAIADPPVATREAYEAVARRGYRLPPPLPPVTQLATWGALADCATNDFEDVLGAHLPGATALLDTLSREGAILARLSGSGSAVFGVFPDDVTAAAAADRAATDVSGAKVFLTATAFTGTEGDGAVSQSVPRSGSPVR